MALWAKAYAEEYTYYRMSFPLMFLSLFSPLFSGSHMCLPRRHDTTVRKYFHICLEYSTLTFLFRIASYLRLVVLAVGFQRAANTQAGLRKDSAIVLKSVHAAREVIQIMVERLYPTGNLQFALQANFLYVSFAAAFLINVSPVTPPFGRSC